MYGNATKLVVILLRQASAVELLITGAVPVRSAHFGSGFGIIHLDNVQCDGSELRLANCTHLGVGNHNCVPSEDAGVICSSG